MIPQPRNASGAPARPTTPGRGWSETVQDERKARRRSLSSTGSRGSCGSGSAPPAVLTKDQLLKHQQTRLDEATYYQGIDTSGGASALPAGWKCCKDSYGRAFYQHEPTGRSCWVEPVVVQIPWKYRAALDALPHLLSSASDTQWVRVTLEADEDRSKLFTAAYRLALDDMLADKHRYFVKKGAGVDASLPTLAVCHKQANRLKVPAHLFFAFLERVLRNKPWKAPAAMDPALRGPQPRTPKTCVHSPHSKSERERTTPNREASCSPRPRRASGQFPSSAPASPRKDRRRGSRSASPPRRRRTLSMDEDNDADQADAESDGDRQQLSMAQYGSLQAKAFRERRLLQLRNAQHVKSHVESHFGRPLRPRDSSSSPTSGGAVAAAPPQLPSITLVRKPDNEQERAQSTLVETVDICSTPPGSPVSRRLSGHSDSARQASERRDFDRNEIDRKLRLVEDLRSQLLEARESVVAPESPPPEPRSPRDEALEAYLSSEPAACPEVSPASTARASRISPARCEPLDVFSENGDGDVGILAASLDLELQAELRRATERLAHAERQLRISQEQRGILEKTAEASRAQADSLARELEEGNKLHASLQARSEQREKELVHKVEELRSQVKREQLAAKEGRDAQSNALALGLWSPQLGSPAESAQNAKARSPNSSKSPAQQAATAAAARNLERLTQTQEELRLANDSRLRAERRAKEMSERVVKLSEALAQALGDKEAEQRDGARLQSDIKILREALEQANSSRDELMEELRGTRESHFVTLESERVERAALNREITDLRARVGELKWTSAGRSGAKSPALGGPDAQFEPPRSQSGIADELKQGDGIDGDGTSKVRRGALVADGETMASSNHAVHALLEEQADKVSQLEKELFDAKCSLSRLSQRLKQSENDAATLRYELKSTRQNWKASERNLESRLQTAQRAATDKAAVAEQCREAEAAAKQDLCRARDEIETLSIHVKETEARLVDVETRKADAERAAMDLRRDHAQQLSMKQREMEDYRAGLERHYARCRSVWESDHADELAQVKDQHAKELESLSSRAKLDSRRFLEEQRTEFAKRTREMEAAFEKRLDEVHEENASVLLQKAQSHSAEMRAALDAAIQAERKHAEAMLSESFVQREVEAVKLRRRGAIAFLLKAWHASNVAVQGGALLRWQRFTAAQRTEELVEVYGAAMDQTNAAAKLVLASSKASLRVKRIAVERWALRTLRTAQVLSPPPPPPPPLPPLLGLSGLSSRAGHITLDAFGIHEGSGKRVPEEPRYYYAYAMYPAELARKIRRKLAHQRYFNPIQSFVRGLPVNLDGKISPKVFQDALLEASARCEKRLVLQGNEENTTASYKVNSFGRPPLRSAGSGQDTNSTAGGKDVLDFEAHLCAAYLSEDFLERAHADARKNSTLASSFALEPSRDWMVMAASAITKLSYWAKRRDSSAKSRAWARLMANCAARTPLVAPEARRRAEEERSKAQQDPLGGTGTAASAGAGAGAGADHRSLRRIPSGASFGSAASTTSRFAESDFLRAMETQALQEEVRALHAQLGASKAEAWKYKRKLLSQYLKEG